MGEEMTILAMIFGISVGMLVAGLFNLHSYNKGRFDGEMTGYNNGYRDGFENAYIRVANVVPFPQKEVPK